MQQVGQETGKEETYSSVAKYFRRFSKRQGKSSPRASLFLRRASKSTRKRPRRGAQESTREEDGAPRRPASRMHAWRAQSVASPEGTARGSGAPASSVRSGCTSPAASAARASAAAPS